MDIAREIRNFIVETFLFGDDSQVFGLEDSFFEKGIVDSTGVLNIVNFVEERFGVSVADEDITPGNFDSVSRISAYIDRKLNGANM